MSLRVASEVTLLEIPPCQIPMCGVAYSCSYVLLLSVTRLFFFFACRLHFARYWTDRQRASVVPMNLKFVGLRVSPALRVFTMERLTFSRWNVFGFGVRTWGIWKNVSHRGKEASCLTWQGQVKRIERLILFFFFSSTRAVRQSDSHPIRGERESSDHDHTLL